MITIALITGLYTCQAQGFSGLHYNGSAETLEEAKHRAITECLAEGERRCEIERCWHTL